MFSSLRTPFGFLVITVVCVLLCAGGIALAHHAGWIAWAWNMLPKNMGEMNQAIQGKKDYWVSAGVIVIAS